NNLDVNGNVCPLYPRRNVDCPLVCVADLNDCPTALRPDCPVGLQYCPDGACAAKCSKTAENPCLCGEARYPAGNDPLPCLKPPIVDVPYYHPENKTAQTQATCGEALGIATTKGFITYGERPTGPMWLDCPSNQHRRHFTFSEPIWLAIWAAITAEALLLGSWWLYKRLNERAGSQLIGVPPTRASQDSSGKKDPLDSDASLTSTENGAPFQSLAGYRSNWMGTLAAASLIVLSVAWLVALAIITADYYGDFQNKPFTLSHGNSGLSAQLFIVVWYFMTAWFLGLNVVKGRLRNFFRLRVDPGISQYVQIEQEIEPLILLDDSSRVLQRIRHYENLMRRRLGWHVHITTSPVYQTDHGRMYFTYQCTRYVFDPDRNSFAPFEFNIGLTAEQILSKQKGLTREEADYRRELLGDNFISVDVVSLPFAIAREFTGFFYLYQLTILWLFYYFSYYQIGLVDTGVVIISALVKVFIRRNSESRLKRMAEHEDTCQVLRDGDWTTLSTAHLVPGDVYQVETDQIVPCDSVILTGNVVADESSLTGEPLPIRKFPLRPDTAEFDITTTGKPSALFGGTTISQAEPEAAGTRDVTDRGSAKAQSLGTNTHEDGLPTLDFESSLALVSGPPTAMVCRIGTATDKGQLVRKILFPNPVSFIFDEQLKLVLCILALEGIAMFGLGIILQRQDLNTSWFTGMFCLAQIISPILPAALVAGQSVASNRLRRKKIFCVDLPRVMMAGKVQIFCFDKTGTLTKEGLDFYGCVPVVEEKKGVAAENGGPGFGERNMDIKTVPRLLGLATASCHAVTKLNERLIGNPVDIEMFKHAGWDLCPPDSLDYLDTLHADGERIHVVKRFEFMHARASMSVAILDPTDNHVHVFVKGSFERLRETARPESVPGDFNAVTNQLAREGCYVLAVAHRDLGAVDPTTLADWTRDDLERDAALLGLVLFKNTLKLDTADAIAELKAGTTRTVMITGDTALTGAFIGRACGLCSPNDRMLLGDVTKDGTLIWRDVDTDEEEPDLHGALLRAAAATTTTTTTKGLSDGGGLELAVTGKAFNELVNRDVIREYLLNIRVFARMTPTDKVTCVQLHMERGITAMCGDGGNDCGALRAAHVGIALSEAEASIVSPFSTSIRSIQSCVELIREGRAALASSFAGYKYLILYGQTMAMMKTNFFYFQGSIAQSLWIVVDAVITMGMTACISLSTAAPRLAPRRPTARLLGPETLSSTVGVVLINWIYLIGGYVWLYAQPWFRCHEFDARGVDISKWWLLGDNYESAYLAFLTMYQFVNNGAIYNFGFLYRRSWWRNYALVTVWAGFIAAMSFIHLADPNILGCFFRLNCGNPNVLRELGYTPPSVHIETYNVNQGHNVFPRHARWVLWGYSMANIVTALVWEKFIVLGPVREWMRRKFPQQRLVVKL
ncbi:hypothetical protein IWQ60_002737, partial [Tieghemiomyces parasiticus]